MADTYKILYRNDLPTGAAVSQYTPGIGKMAIVKNITLYNHGANTETVIILLNGANANNQWGGSRTLAPKDTDGDTMEWDGTLALANTDAIFANSTDATAVTMIVSGDEVS